MEQNAVKNYFISLEDCVQLCLESFELKIGAYLGIIHNIGSSLLPSRKKKLEKRTILVIIDVFSIVKYIYDIVAKQSEKYCGYVAILQIIVLQ